MISFSFRENEIGKQSYQKNKCVPHKFHGDCTKITCGKALVVNYLHELSRNYLLYGDDFFQSLWLGLFTCRVLVFRRSLWKWFDFAKFIPMLRFFINCYFWNHLTFEEQNAHLEIQKAVFQTQFWKKVLTENSILAILRDKMMCQ